LGSRSQDEVTIKEGDAMSFAVTEVLLWLFIIVLGTAFGAGLYEARVVVPLWASAPPASLRSPESGHRFWVVVTTIPLTLLTLANLAAAWQAQGPSRA
jgi:H+/Cl- antiporter ClcA